MALRFEWDATKARGNAKKHGISFDEASTAFRDPLSITILDSLHSQGEERLVLLGQSQQGRLLVVVHTEFGNGIRLISARLAGKKERHWYEEERQ